MQLDTFRLLTRLYIILVYLIHFDLDNAQSSVSDECAKNCFQPLYPLICRSENNRYINPCIRAFSFTIAAHLVVLSGHSNKEKQNTKEHVIKTLLNYTKTNCRHKKFWHAVACD